MSCSCIILFIARPCPILSLRLLMNIPAVRINFNKKSHSETCSPWAGGGGRCSHVSDSQFALNCERVRATQELDTNDYLEIGEEERRRTLDNLFVY